MNMAMFIPGMSGLPEILLILFVILLLFGSKRLPDLARSLGRSLGEFKKGREESEKKISAAQSAETSEEDSSAPKQK